MFLFFILALPDPPEEKRLLAQARRGDQAAIARIYELYFDPLYRFICWRVDDLALAEDLTGDVFVKFLNALQSGRAPTESLRGWLFRVARNALYDHYHHLPDIDALDDDLPAPDGTGTEALVLRDLDAAAVRGALRQLSPDQQDVLVLRFGQMLSLQETADSLGKSVSAVKSLQFRAINALRRALQEAEYDAV